MEYNAIPIIITNFLCYALCFEYICWHASRGRIVGVDEEKREERREWKTSSGSISYGSSGVLHTDACVAHHWEKLCLIKLDMKSGMNVA